MKFEVFSFPKGVVGVIIWRSEDGKVIGVRTKKMRNKLMRYTTHLISVEGEEWSTHSATKKFLRELFNG